MIPLFLIFFSSSFFLEVKSKKWNEREYLYFTCLNETYVNSYIVDSSTGVVRDQIGVREIPMTSPLVATSQFSVDGSDSGEVMRAFNFPNGTSVVEWLAVSLAGGFSGVRRCSFTLQVACLTFDAHRQRLLAVAPSNLSVFELHPGRNNSAGCTVTTAAPFAAGDTLLSERSCAAQGDGALLFGVRTADGQARLVVQDGDAGSRRELPLPGLASSRMAIQALARDSSLVFAAGGIWKVTRTPGNASVVREAAMPNVTAAEASWAFLDAASARVYWALATAAAGEITTVKGRHVASLPKIDVPALCQVEYSVLGGASMLFFRWEGSAASNRAVNTLLETLSLVFGGIFFLLFIVTVFGTFLLIVFYMFMKSRGKNSRFYEKLEN